MKGGLFVASAVVTGIIVGLLLPTLVGAEPDAANKPRAHASLGPTMPSVVGRPLDEAESRLRGRGIAYETNTPDIVDALVPDVLEVCESSPPPGRSVRGTARLQAAVRGTCGL
jgi:PASTA domain